MLKENKRITVAISGHWLLGDLSLAGNRIQEALNDHRTDFLKLTDVEVHPIADRESVVRLAGSCIPKNKVELVAVPTNQHEAPVKRWNNRTAKSVYPSFVIAGDYRVQAELHLPNKPNEIQYILTQQVGQFFALTNAHFSLGEDRFNVPLLLVNKESVSCLHVGEPAQAANGDATELSSFVGSF